MASSQSALIVRLADVSRKGTTSRSSDYATGRTSFRPNAVSWASANRTSGSAISDRFPLRAIYDRSPEAFLINVIHQYCLSLVLSTGERNFFPQCLLSLNVFFTCYRSIAPHYESERDSGEKKSNISCPQCLRCATDSLLIEIMELFVN